jgi:hypothetical protein
MLSTRNESLQHPADTDSSGKAACHGDDGGSRTAPCSAAFFGAIAVQERKYIRSRAYQHNNFDKFLY